LAEAVRLELTHPLP